MTTTDPDAPPQLLMTLAQSAYIRLQLYKLAQTDAAQALLIRTELNGLARPITRQQAREIAEKLLGPPA